MEDFNFWFETWQTLNWFFKYGSPMAWITVMMAVIGASAMISIPATQLISVFHHWLELRHKRALEETSVRRIEAISKLTEVAQMRLLETFPGIDPDNPSDVEAAKLAERELALLTEVGLDGVVYQTEAAHKTAHTAHKTAHTAHKTAHDE